MLAASSSAEERSGGESSHSGASRPRFKTPEQEEVQHASLLLVPESRVTNVLIRANIGRFIVCMAIVVFSWGGSLYASRSRCVYGFFPLPFCANGVIGQRLSQQR